jgi:hypothetical protein
MPFADHTNELLYYVPKGQSRDGLLQIAVIDNIFKRAQAFGDYLGTSSAPHEDILKVAAMTTAGEPAGLKLVYACLLAVPPADAMVTELVEFKNVMRAMAFIARKERSQRALKESEDWFRKKVVLLSTSHPLPGGSTAPEGKPWLGWGDGVRRALADPDRRWDKAVLERARVEIEALDFRISQALSTIDFGSKPNSMIYLLTRGDEARWRIQALEGAYQRFGGASLIIREKLADKWAPMVEELRKSKAGAALADLFEKQISRVHPYPHLKTGTSVVRALLMHPLLLRVQRKPDYLSCLSLYVTHAAGNGTLEILLHKLAAVNMLKVLMDLPGFQIDQRILTVDLMKVPPAPFVDLDDMPRDVDWTNIAKEEIISYRTLVMTYMDNDNFIAEILNNPRISSKAGVVSIIALKSRSARILSIISNRRDLYTGLLNKDVPRSLLENPARLPLSSLRKFVHVRYVDKATLARLAGKGSQIREEVRREIQRYLASLK